MVNLNEMTREELLAHVQRLEANQGSSDGLKVSEKGGVSVYGIGRFPVTLYSSQWERLLAKSDAIKQFIADNSDKLAVKPAKQ
jgi:hypothetical protein